MSRQVGPRKQKSDISTEITEEFAWKNAPEKIKKAKFCAKRRGDLEKKFMKNFEDDAIFFLFHVCENPVEFVEKMDFRRYAGDTWFRIQRFFNAFIKCGRIDLARVLFFRNVHYFNMECFTIDYYQYTTIKTISRDFIERSIGKIIIRAFETGEMDTLDNLVNDFPDFITHAKLHRCDKFNVSIFPTDFVRGMKHFIFNHIEPFTLICNINPDFFDLFPDRSIMTNDPNIIRNMIMVNRGMKIDPMGIFTTRNHENLNEQDLDNYLECLNNCQIEIDLKGFLDTFFTFQRHEYFQVAEICDDFVITKDINPGITFNTDDPFDIIRFYSTRNDDEKEIIRRKFPDILF